MIKGFFRFIFAQKLKILVLISSTLMFIFLLFPFNDLSDFFSAKVSLLTQNRLYLQFEKLRMSIFPNPGVGLEDVHVETGGLPAIKAREVILSPSVGSLISQKPAGTFIAKGLLQGDVEITMKPGKKSDSGNERQNFTIAAKKVSLEEVRAFARLPLAIKGNLNLETEALADLTFTEQPDADVTLKVQDFVLPPSNVPTPMGPLAISGLKLGSIELKGRLSSGKFQIETGNIGQDGDEIRGTIKGGISLQIRNGPNGIATIPGAYNFEVELKIKKSLQQREKLLLGLLDQYKTPGDSDSDRFAFKVSASDVNLPPSIGALR